MKTRDTKVLLWQNVSALMTARYGKPNLTRLAADAKIGPGTASRIKQHETSVGLEVVEAIAKAFKVQPWQLLTPNFQPGQLGQQATGDASWPFLTISRESLSELPPEKLLKIEGYIEAMLEAQKSSGPGKLKAA